MTEFWKSHAMYWCEYCKVWMNDNPATKATHENGLKHKENVSKRLRDMRKKQDADKKGEVLAKHSMASIETAAKAQYEADKRAEEATRLRVAGSWVLDDEAKYFYNELHRWYYDTHSNMYFGGDPPEWTADPPIPAEARFPRKEEPAKAASSKPAPKNKVYHHPLSEVGGYQMPASGTIGGIKGVGGDGRQAKRKADSALVAAKAKAKAKKPVTKEEEAAVAARDAAKARVAKRTAQTFGFS